MHPRFWCFRDISSICWRIFTKLLSLVHLGTEMTWLRFWVKRSKFKVTPSRRRHTALDATVECTQHSTLPSSATFSSYYHTRCFHVLNLFTVFDKIALRLKSSLRCMSDWLPMMLCDYFLSTADQHILWRIYFAFQLRKNVMTPNHFAELRTENITNHTVSKLCHKT